MKQASIEHIRLKILLPLIVVLAALLTFHLYSTSRMRAAHINESVRLHLQSTRQLFQTLLAEESRQLEAEIHSLKSNAKLQAAWLAKDKEQLFEAAAPLYKKLNSNYDVTHFYFIDTNKECFLRVHNPTRRGDIIKRFTLEEAVSTEKLAHGIELGPLGTFTLRVVLPWKSADKLIGYLEIGKEIGHFTSKLKQTLNVEIITVINKNFLDRSHWVKGMQMLGRNSDWALLRQFIISNSTLTNPPKEIDKIIGLSHQDHNQRLFNFSTQEKSFYGATNALIDAGGRDVGDMLVLKDVSAQLAESEKDFRKWSICVGAVALLLLVFFSRLLSHLQNQLFHSSRKIMENEERYRRLFESSRDAIMTLSPSSGIFTSANHAALEIFGAENVEKFTSLGPGALSPQHQADGSLSAEKAARMINMALEDGSNFFEWTHKRLNGKSFPASVLLTKVTIRDECFVQATVRDISTQKIIEAELRESEERHRVITESARDAIIAADDTGRIVFWNRAAEEMFGYGEQEILGRSLFDTIIPPRFREAKRKGIAGFLKTGPDKPAGQVLEVKALRKNGREFPISLSLSSYSQNSQLMEVALIRDISDQKALESEVLQGEKTKAIGTLAAGIAHEINTPAQFIKDNVTFLQDTSGDLLSLLKKYDELRKRLSTNQDTNKLLNEIEQLVAEADIEYCTEEIPRALSESLEGLNHVAEIVRAMKSFAHPGSDNKQSVDLNKTLEDTIIISRNEWKYVAELKTQFDPALPPVLCYPSEVNQVVLNLIVNAAHAISDSAGSKGGKSGAIKVSSRAENGSAIIEVHDNGSGIPEEIRSQIFDPFFTTKTVGTGSGQGLAIAHGIIAKRHGGRITCQSELGKGTIFTVELPLGG